MIDREIVVGGKYDYVAQEKNMKLAKLMNLGVVIELLADVFLRGAKRKPKETFKSYKRSMKNAGIALKQRLKVGPKATVLLNKSTMCIVN